MSRMGKKVPIKPSNVNYWLHYILSSFECKHPKSRNHFKFIFIVWKWLHTRIYTLWPTVQCLTFQNLHSQIILMIPVTQHSLWNHNIFFSHPTKPFLLRLHHVKDEIHPMIKLFLFRCQFFHPFSVSLHFHIFGLKTSIALIFSS